MRMNSIFFKIITVVLVLSMIVASSAMTAFAGSQTASTSGGTETANFNCTASYTYQTVVTAVRGVISPTVPGHFVMDSLTITTRLYISDGSPIIDSGTKYTANSYTFTGRYYPSSMVSAGNVTFSGVSSHYGRFSRTVNC